MKYAIISRSLTRTTQRARYRVEELASDSPTTRHDGEGCSDATGAWKAHCLSTNQPQEGGRAALIEISPDAWIVVAFSLDDPECLASNAAHAILNAHAAAPLSERTAAETRAAAIAARENEARRQAEERLARAQEAADRARLAADRAASQVRSARPLRWDSLGVALALAAAAELARE